MKQNEARVLLGSVISQYWPQWNEARRAQVWEGLDSQQRLALRLLYDYNGEAADNSQARCLSVDADISAAAAPALDTMESEPSLAELIHLDSAWEHHAQLQSAVALAGISTVDTARASADTEPGLAGLIDVDCLWKERDKPRAVNVRPAMIRIRSAQQYLPQAAPAVKVWSEYMPPATPAVRPACQKRSRQCSEPSSGQCCIKAVCLLIVIPPLLAFCTCLR